MKRTIQKVLAELSKDKPDLSYIRGLLEGLVDEEPELIKAKGLIGLREEPTILSDEILTDEQKETAAKYARAGLGRIS